MRELARFIYAEKRDFNTRKNHLEMYLEETLPIVLGPSLRESARVCTAIRRLREFTCTIIRFLSFDYSQVSAFMFTISDPGTIFKLRVAFNFRTRNI